MTHVTRYPTLTPSLAILALAASACAGPEPAPVPVRDPQVEALQATGARIVRVPIAADASVRSVLPNTAHGGDVRVHVGRNGFNTDRTVLRVDSTAIHDAVGSQRLVSAALELDIETQSPTWTPGGRVVAHKLTRAWSETGVTWSCASDSVPGNFGLDCTTANRWSFEPGATHPYVEAASGQVELGAAATGTISIDVTDDGRGWLTSPAGNQGWALTLADDPAFDWVNFYSRTGARPPTLVVVTVGDCDVDQGTCGTVARWEGADGGDLPVLADPLGGQATFQLASSFDWATTHALPETTAEGFPTIYYAMIYVESSEQLGFLDEYRIDWDPLPYFREERTQWDGQVGVVPLQGDGNGIFVFALVPGPVYNAMRTLALAGDEPYAAVVLRTPPASVARYADGSISYQLLRDEGFEWRRYPGDAGNDGVHVRRFGRWLRHAAQAVVEAGKKAVDKVREGVGEISKLLKGEAALQLTFLPQNLDNSFKKDLLRRGWGARRGTALALEHITVRVRQGLGFALFQGKTDDTGFTRIVVAKDRPTDICLELENDAAIVTSFVLPRLVCDFGGGHSIARSDLHGTVARTFLVASKDVASFGEVTDAARYAQLVMGRHLHKARMLVGALADVVMLAIEKVSGGTQAVTPCIGLSGDGFERLALALLDMSHSALEAGKLGGLDLLLPGLGVTLASVGTSGAATLFAASVVGPDMILGDAVKGNRGVPVHEYGHFAMCSLMQSASATQMSRAYMQVIIDRVMHTDDAGAEAGYIAEGWADFYAAQVVGGTNYFALFNSRNDRPGKMSYCPTRETSCLDDNVGGPADGSSNGMRSDITPLIFNNMARITTTLEDMVDGQADGQSNVPGDGASWTNGGWIGATGTPIDAEATLRAPNLDFFSSHQNDEPVEVSGHGLGRLFDEWAAQPGSRLSQPTLFGAMTELMRDSGVSDETICNLFALHDPRSLCPSFLPIAKNLTPAAVLSLSGYTYSSDPGVVDLNGHHGHWAWQSFAPYATGFELTLRNLTAGTTLATSTMPFTRFDMVAFNRQNLPFNVELELGVVVANGARKSPKSRFVITTPAEPVALPFARSLTPGRTEICFTETVASAYTLEVRAGASGTWKANGRVVDGAGDAIRCHVFVGLPASPHDFHVVAENRHGRATTASPVLTVTPLPLRDVFVSAARGDDASPTAGTRATPFKTLEAALAFVAQRRVREIVIPCSPVPPQAPGCPFHVRQTDYDGARLNLATGTYVLANPWHETGAAFVTEVLGGLDDTTWATTTSRSTIRGVAQTVAGGASCTAMPTLAPILVDGGAALLLRRLDRTTGVAPAPVGDEPPMNAVAHAGQAATLVISGSRVFVDGVPAVGAGSAPISGFRASIEVEDSIVSSRTGAASNLTGAWLMGVCGRDLTRLELTATDVSSTNAVLGSGATSAAALVPVLVTGAAELLVARSFVRVAPAAPAFRPGAGQAALLVSSVGMAFIHDSVLRTNNGGTANIVAYLAAGSDGRSDVAGDQSTIDIVQSTLVAGYDFGFAGVGPPVGGQAAVLALAGRPTSTSLVNNVLSWAAGRTSDAVLIDRSGLLADPHGALIIGNVLSLPFNRVSKPAVMRCSLTDYRDGWFDYPPLHACFDSDEVSTSYTLYGNTVLARPGCEAASSPAACFADMANWHPQLSEERAVTLDTLGMPRANDDPFVTCAASGGYWRQDQSRRDVQNLDRFAPLAGVDDDCDGHIDEAGERSSFSSSGAFSGPCRCPAQEVLIL